MAQSPTMTRVLALPVAFLPVSDSTACQARALPKPVRSYLGRVPSSSAAVTVPLDLRVAPFRWHSLCCPATAGTWAAGLWTALAGIVILALMWSESSCPRLTFQLGPDSEPGWEAAMLMRSGSQELEAQHTGCSDECPDEEVIFYIVPVDKSARIDWISNAVWYLVCWNDWNCTWCNM